MNRLAIILSSLLTCAEAHAQSAAKTTHFHSIETTSIDPKAANQCGMSMDVPNIKDANDETIGFGCTGTYKRSVGAGLLMSFDYDPNFDMRGGDRIEFDVYAIGIDELIVSGRKGSPFRLKPGDSHPTLADGVAFPWSGCGPVVKTTVTPLQGVNWHGWIAEDTFQTPRKGCVPVDKEYTSAYRCIHVMVGNAKMTAMLGGVCLLRKREYSLENGFSYDLFMDMLRTLRFKEE